jgi:hypothetical protein
VTLCRDTPACRLHNVTLDMDADLEAR